MYILTYKPKSYKLIRVPGHLNKNIIPKHKKYYLTFNSICFLPVREKSLPFWWSISLWKNPFLKIYNDVEKKALKSIFLLT